MHARAHLLSNRVAVVTTLSLLALVACGGSDDADAAGGDVGAGGAAGVSNAGAGRAGAPAAGGAGAGKAGAPAAAGASAGQAGAAGASAGQAGAAGASAGKAGAGGASAGQAGAAGASAGKAGAAGSPVTPPEVTVGEVEETQLFDVVGTSTAYTALQGGASDGTYAYAVVLDTQAGDIDVSQLLKYQISTGKRVASVSFGAPGKVTNKLGHGNDATFNPDTGRLVVPAWTNDSSTQPANNGKLLRIIDPATLAIVDTRTVDVNVTNLCYAKGTYLIFTGGSFRTYDAGFKLVDSTPFDIVAVEDKYAPKGATRVGQGIDCDADYVYLTRWYPDADTNRLYVATWAGELVGAYTWDGPEGEHLMHVSGARILHGINTPGAGGDLRRIEKFQYVVEYLAEGGAGSMPSTRVLYGRYTPLRQSAFTLAGKAFAGWAAERLSDGKWRYEKPDGSDDGWYAKGGQPSGWSYYVYADGAKVAKTAPYGLVRMHAQWK